MPITRYSYRDVLLNTLRRYRAHRQARNIRRIDHYATPNMEYPSPSQQARMTPISHVWKHGDRYYKLAHKYYGDKKLWWLIGWYNKSPTESHLTMGQVIQIPMPLEVALSYMREKPGR